MIVLGLDPGTRTAGFGVVDVERRTERALDYGTIEMADDLDHSLRLMKVGERVLELADEYKPDAIAVEVPFMGKNVQSMRKLARVEGVVMYVAMAREIPLAQYAPAEIKKAVTGKGRATKEQVEYFIRAALGVAVDKLDASDALAVALAHGRRGIAGPPAASASKDWAAFIKANPGRVR
ncbi:crossover junction endodeoxyribonuclease RuvC [Rubrivirga sp.]|uniref:crossover junction endodeoxyribonuclease RuvC n=1 Tax=Rubrivirga sp. TaxID=1885344 RepID=UPI003C7103F3